jgi:hypothetical protein
MSNRVLVRAILVGFPSNFILFSAMLTYLFAVKIAGFVISTENLFSAAWFSFFIASEYLANHPKIRANSIFQLITGYIKSVRHEDDQINAIKQILKGKGRR